MKRNWIVVSIVLVFYAIIIHSFSCSPKESELVELPPAQDIVSNVIESQGKIETYWFDIKTSMDITSEGKQFSFDLNSDLTGVLDISNKQMHMEMTTNTETPGENKVEARMETYLIDDVMYVMQELPQKQASWSKSDIIEGFWEKNDPLETVGDLYEEAQIDVIGTEKINDTECFVLKITPDLQKLMEMAIQQAHVPGSTLANIQKDSIQDMLQGFSIKQWIAMDTYYMIKTDIRMKIELNSDLLQMPVNGGKIQMDTGIEILCYDYNKSVSIILPTEAKEAPSNPLR